MLKFARNQKENLHAWHDVGLATAQLIIQTVSEGLLAHPMAGIERDVIFKTYRIPENVAAVTAIAIGYLDKVEAMPDEYREAETAARVRRPAYETFFTDDWGHPLFPNKT
jgi:nitroreductase